MAAPGSCLLLLLILSRESLLLLMITAQLKRPIKQLLHIHLFTNQLAGRGCLSFPHEVAATKFIRSQPQRSGNFIELSLERKNTLRCAKPSKSAVRRHIGSNR